MANKVKTTIREELGSDRKREERIRALQARLNSYQVALNDKNLTENARGSVYGKVAEIYEGLFVLTGESKAWMAAGDAWLLAGKEGRAGQAYDKYLTYHRHEVIQHARQIRRSGGEGGLARKTTAAIITISVFLLSIIFAVNSFTGYVISEEVNMTANWTALLFFLVGLIGAYYLLWRKE